MNNFARTLQNLIEQTGLSQVAIEKRTGINQASISRYKNGVEYPKVSSLPHLLMAFDDKKHKTELFIHWMKEHIPEEITDCIEIRSPYKFSKKAKFYKHSENVVLNSADERNIKEFLKLFEEKQDVRNMVESLVNIVNPKEQLKVAEDSPDYSG